MKQDYLGFAKTQLAQRREVGLPPFARMVRLVLRDQDLEKLQKFSEQLFAALTAAIAADDATRQVVKSLGPTPCAIGRIAGYHRYQIVLSAPRPEPLQRLLSNLRPTGVLAHADRIAVDVDPVALL